MIDTEFWRGRRVFLTGHTGFKGGWATLLLRYLGAEVTGYALPPEHEDGVFCTAHCSQSVHDIVGDIRDASSLQAAVAAATPEVVIHMAAQSLVRLSYDRPVDTYATNVMGTVHLLEAVRHTPGILAVVIVTSEQMLPKRRW